MSTRQQRVSYKIEIRGHLAFLIQTRNPKLTSILEYSDHKVLRRKIVDRHINSTDPWVASIKEVLIKEVADSYERESGRSFEWSGSCNYTSEMLKGRGILYMIPTEKEINKRVKTRDWRWVNDGLGHWVETKRKRYDVSCFHKPEVIFIEIKKLVTSKSGDENNVPHAG